MSKIDNAAERLTNINKSLREARTQRARAAADLRNFEQQVEYWERAKEVVLEKLRNVCDDQG